MQQAITYGSPLVSFDLVNGRHFLVVPMFALNQTTVSVQVKSGLVFQMVVFIIVLKDSFI